MEQVEITDDAVKRLRKYNTDERPRIDSYYDRIMVDMNNFKNIIEVKLPEQLIFKKKKIIIEKACDNNGL